MNPITCPHCSQELTEEQIRSLNGKLSNALRKNPSGGKGKGRPVLPKCACGRYTTNQAIKRRHVCEEVANAKT